MKATEKMKLSEHLASPSEATLSHLSELERKLTSFC